VQADTIKLYAVKRRACRTQMSVLRSSAIRTDPRAAGSAAGTTTASRHRRSRPQSHGPGTAPRQRLTGLLHHRQARRNGERRLETDGLPGNHSNGREKKTIGRHIRVAPSFAAEKGAARGRRKSAWPARPLPHDHPKPARRAGGRDDGRRGRKRKHRPGRRGGDRRTRGRPHRARRYRPSHPGRMLHSDRVEWFLSSFREFPGPAVREMRGPQETNCQFVHRRNRELQKPGGVDQQYEPGSESGRNQLTCVSRERVRARRCRQSCKVTAETRQRRVGSA